MSATLFRAIGALVLLFSLLVGGANAEELNCQAYGVKAVAQNQQNMDMSCGFGGGAWNPSLSDHVNWCKTARMADLTREDNARANALKSCVNGQKAAEAAAIEQEARQRQQIAICKSYARSALEQQAINVSRKCGFGGGGWTDNYAGHFEWCLGASELSIIAEGQARENQLIGCKSAQQATENARCDEYAGITSAQFKTMNARKCGFEGGLWSGNANSFKNWCLKSSAAAAKSRSDRRANDLDKSCGKTVCTTTRSGFPKFTSTTRCRYVPNR